jgi:hypothetical protein
MLIFCPISSFSAKHYRDGFLLLHMVLSLLFLLNDCLILIYNLDTLPLLLGGVEKISVASGFPVSDDTGTNPPTTRISRHALFLIRYSIQ